jgi:ribosomal protein L16/L10AE
MWLTGHGIGAVRVQGAGAAVSAVPAISAGATGWLPAGAAVPVLRGAAAHAGSGQARDAGVAVGGDGRGDRRGGHEGARVARWPEGAHTGTASPLLRRRRGKGAHTSHHKHRAREGRLFSRGCASLHAERAAALRCRAQEAAMNQMLKTMMAKQGMPMPPTGGCAPRPKRVVCTVRRSLRVGKRRSRGRRSLSRAAVRAQVAVRDAACGWRQPVWDAAHTPGVVSPSSPRRRRHPLADHRHHRQARSCRSFRQKTHRRGKQQFYAGGVHVPGRGPQRGEGVACPPLLSRGPSSCW